MTYDALTKAGATVFGYGAFLTAFINFLLLAFAIFWLVKFINAAKNRALAEQTSVAVAPTPEDIVLLREIRDALKK
jgi:large conductance mechanosensitive channel